MSYIGTDSNNAKSSKKIHIIYFHIPFAACLQTLHSITTTLIKQNRTSEINFQNNKNSLFEKIGRDKTWKIFQKGRSFPYYKFISCASSEDFETAASTAMQNVSNRKIEQYFGNLFAQQHHYPVNLDDSNMCFPGICSRAVATKAHLIQSVPISMKQTGKQVQTL